MRFSLLMTIHFQICSNEKSASTYIRDDISHAGSRGDAEIEIFEQVRVCVVVVGSYISWYYGGLLDSAAISPPYPHVSLTKALLSSPTLLSLSAGVSDGSILPSCSF